MKIGLIGLGYWGPNLARVLQQSPACDFSACCDISADRVNKIRQQYPTVRGYATTGELLKSDVGAVVIATPISTHYKLALEALSCGKHVMVEKPIADSVQDAEHLVEVARQKGLTLMVGHTFIYSPPVVKIKQLIDAGEVGDLYYISVSRVNLGLYQKDVDVLWDLAVHDISILLYWTRELPVTVRASGRACVQKDKNDVAFLWLQFPSGLVASCEVSWLSPQKMRRTTVVGSKRMVVYDDTDPSEKVRIYDRGVTVRAPETFGEYQLTYRMGDMLAPSLSNQEPLAVEVQHFAECAKTGSRPTTDGEFGVDVVRVLEAAVHSRAADSGPARGQVRSAGQP